MLHLFRHSFAPLLAVALGACSSSLSDSSTAAADSQTSGDVDAAAPSPPPKQPPGSAPPEPTAPSDAYAQGAEEPIDDAVEDTLLDPAAQPVAHPLDGWSEDRIETALLDDPESLGSMSIGATNGGSLFNGMRMPEGEHWEITGAPHVWGTEETIDAIIHCIEQVHEQFPDTKPLPIGHISRKEGGHLTPHLSHQAGRDVDMGYYYRGTERWFRRATAANLDRARTWALVRAIITDTDVELILINASLQRLLREHAESIGEDSAWLDSVFRGGNGRRALIRHARGHDTHIHVRFYSPIARETSRRVAPAMIKHGMIEPPKVYVWHRARRGDTLGKLAKRYGTTVKAIQRANGLRSTVIIAKKSYRIPKEGAVAPQAGPIQVPPRRLPPHEPGQSPSGAAQDAG